MKKTILITLLVVTKLAFTQPTQQWAYSYNYSLNSCDIPSIMKMDNSGNIYICGTTQQSNPTALPDFLTMKINSSGFLGWMRTYNGTGNDQDIPHALCIDNSGNVYVAGSSVRPVRGWDGVLIKYNSAGVQQWIQRYDVPEDEYNVFNAMTLDQSGNIYVAGGTGGNGFNVVLIKYDNSGNQQWIARITDPQYFDAGADAVIADHNGNIYLSGTNEMTEMNYNLLAAKYNNSGVRQWIKTFDCRFEEPTDQYVSVDDANNFYITASGSFNISQSCGILTFKYDSNGNLLWNNRFGYDTARNYAYGMSLDNSGNIFVSGYLANNNSNGDEMTTLKYNPQGTELWRQLFTYYAGSYAIAQSQALDKAGNVYVTGWASHQNQSSTTTTLKYSSSGVLEWTKQYLDDQNNSSSLVLTDTSNNVFVAGYKDNNLTNADYLLIKYSQLTGINTLSENIPKAFSLYQNFPNPFNPSTVIKFDLPEEGSVAIRIYDIAGKEVYSETGYKKAGTYEFKFDGTNLASGMYFYRIQSGSFVDTKKMVLIK